MAVAYEPGFGKSAYRNIGPSIWRTPRKRLNHGGKITITIDHKGLYQIRRQPNIGWADTLYRIEEDSKNCAPDGLEFGGGPGGPSML